MILKDIATAMRRIRKYKITPKEQREIIDGIYAVAIKESQILFGFLYGSFLSELSFRDIDLGVFVRDLDTSSYWDYECKISQQIEDAIPSSFPVETKVINNAPLSFCFNVIRGKLLFTRDEDLLLAFVTRTAKKYLDSAPLIHKYMREAMT